MGLFQSKTVAPTLDEKAAAANRKTARVLDTFETFARDLESGADEFKSVADDASAEAARLTTLSNESNARAAKATTVAQNLRNLTV